MNIPSPYRWYLFTRLHEICARQGIEFQVAFLSPRSRNRRWQLDDFPPSFCFWVPWRINLSRNGDRLLNPTLVLRLLYEHWDWIILGGYDNPTTGLLALLSLPRVRVKLIRNEGNLQSYSRFTRGPLASVKRMLLKRCDGYLVPGQRGLEWLDHWLPQRSDKPVYIFPNVIDDRRLVARVAELRQKRDSLRQSLGITDGVRVFMTPARLSPEKGLLEFVENLPVDFAEKNVWLIAGEGPLRGAIESKLIEKNLQRVVRLLGYISPDRMPELYAITDIFVLPSLSDPNPLSVVEAAFAGLPLLISERVGNYPELLVENTTGWGFDPMDCGMTQRAILKAVNAPVEQLDRMSQWVFKYAYEYFQSDRACSALVDFLWRIHPDHKQVIC